MVKGCSAASVKSVQNQVLEGNQVKYSDKTRCIAVAIYLNNSRFRAIGRVLDVPLQQKQETIKRV